MIYVPPYTVGPLHSHLRASVWSAVAWLSKQSPHLPESSQISRIDTFTFPFLLGMVGILPNWPPIPQGLGVSQSHSRPENSPFPESRDCDHSLASPRPFLLLQNDWYTSCLRPEAISINRIFTASCMQPFLPPPKKKWKGIYVFSPLVLYWDQIRTEQMK